MTTDRHKTGWHAVWTPSTAPMNIAFGTLAALGMVCAAAGLVGLATLPRTDPTPNWQYAWAAGSAALGAWLATRTGVAASRWLRARLMPLNQLGVCLGSLLGLVMLVLRFLILG